jgi:hypothetical protein
MKRVGLSVAIAAAILCAAWAPAQAQQQQYGQQPPQVLQNTYVTWGTNTPGQNIIDVTYYVGNWTGVGNTANMLRQAAAAWNSTGAFVHLVELDPTNPGNMAAANVIFQTGVTPGGLFVSANRPTAAQPGTFFPNGAPWVQINGQVVITVNSGLMPFVFVGPGPYANQLPWDFNAFALQMMGYALGLGPAFAGDLNSVMNPTIPFGAAPSGPTSADAASLLAVYGSPEPATFALFGVGLAALGFSRKFRRR